MKRDAGVTGGGLKTLLAPHAEHGYEDLIEACRDIATGCPGIRSLTHLTLNSVDFAVRDAEAEPFPATRSWDDEVETEGLPAQRLVRWVLETDSVMRPLLTGELMRVLIVTRSGGMQYSRVRDGQYLVGMATDSDACRAMDDRMNPKVTEVRRLLYDQGDEMPGGSVDVAKQPLTDQVPLAMQVSTDDRDEENRLRGIWLRHLNPDDLNHAAYYRAGRSVCAGDCFEHSKPDKVLRGVAPQRRRAMYRELVTRMLNSRTELGEILAPLTGDPIERLVLDVQMGAFFMHWLDHAAGDFAVGVTAFQEQVKVAEERLGDLIHDLGRR